MTCANAAEVMREHGIDQLPVVDDICGVVGVATLGNLTSCTLAGNVRPNEPISKVTFTQFAQVSSGAPLGALRKIFETHAYCLVVAPTVRKAVVGVVTQVDLLRFVMHGPIVAMPDGAGRDSYRTCIQHAWSFMKPSSKAVSAP